MSPERAREIVTLAIIETPQDAVNAILAACAEAEREAYTRALNECNKQRGINDCIRVIEALRDATSQQA